MARRIVIELGKKASRKMLRRVRQLRDGATKSLHRFRDFARKRWPAEGGPLQWRGGRSTMVLRE
jgi:hypothetical protein